MKRRLPALILCLALLLAVPVCAESMGEAVDGWTATLAGGATLHQDTYWTGSDYRTENYVEAGASLRPVAASWDTLCAAGSLGGMAAKLEAQGAHVVAGVNGGYFNMTDNTPVGLVVQDGVLRSTDEGLWAVGFREDGSVIFGKPALWMALKADTAYYEVSAVNKTGMSGLTLYTDDFAATTKRSGKNWNIVCVLDGDLPLRGTVRLTVESVSLSDGAYAIPEGRAVLCLAGTDEEPPALIAALSEGMELELTVVCKAGWEDVKSAVGILYKLVTDGSIETGLETAAAPRTAIGVKADGSVVLYTVDGRQSGYSVGAGMDRVARRMQELGCVEAGCLDGGGSTNLCAVLPGDGGLSTIGSPSGGYARSVANDIFLVTDAEPTGTAARLALYPLDIDALVGAETELTVKAVDENGYPAVLPESVSFAVSDGLGTVTDGVFRAEKAGTGTITASASGLESVSIPVSVIASPDEMRLYGEVYGKLTTELTLSPGQEVDLTVRALSNHVLLTGTDECFTWTLEPDGGTVDGTGHIVPALVSGTGALTVMAGECSTQIPITAWTGVPFRDISAADDCFAAVRYVYENDIFKGTGDTTFEPDTVMNRGMIVTVLWRLSGAPAAENAPTFLDVSPENWYGSAVAWAAENGIVCGYSETAFGPLDELTKEQILAVLYRWAGEPEMEMELWAPDDADTADVDDWAAPAMAWAVNFGIVTPDGSGNFLPRAPMTRAGVALTLMRYLTLK